MEEEQEVVVVDINVDGRQLEYLLVDVLDVKEKRYAVLFTEDGLAMPEDRTLFARIEESDAGDSFSLVSDPVELDLVIATAALNAVEDLLVMVRNDLRGVLGDLNSVEVEPLGVDNRNILGIIKGKVETILTALNEEGQDDEQESDE